MGTNLNFQRNDQGKLDRLIREAREKMEDEEEAIKKARQNTNEICPSDPPEIKRLKKMAQEEGEKTRRSNAGIDNLKQKYPGAFRSR